MRRLKAPSLTLAAVLVAGALAACGSSGSGGGSTVTLSLVAYPTPQAAYRDIIKAFQ